MKKIASCLLISVLLLGCTSSPEKTSEKGTDEIKRIVDVAFEMGNLTPEALEKSTNKALKKAEALKSELMAAENRNYNNTLRKYDLIFNELNQMLNPLELIIEVHPEQVVREKGEEVQKKLNNYKYDLELDEGLYSALTEYSETDEAKSLTGFKRKFLDDELLKFRQNGMNLSSEKRKEVKRLKSNIDRLSTTFRTNIAASSDFIEITDKDTAGLDPEFLSAREIDEGTYKLDLSYPTYAGVIAYSELPELRKKYMTLFQNRGMPDNLEVLDSVLYYRLELAQLLGYENYSEYILATRMAKSPRTVWEFENDLIEKLQEKARYDYDLLLAYKSEITGEQATEIYEWETSYLTNKYKKDKFNLDNKELSNYFEMNKVMDGLFQITQTMFGLRYEELENPDVWHPEVRMFNCYDAANNQLIGRFYLDMFPRENKYSHAAMFTVAGGMKDEDGVYHIPEAALVCNFPRPQGDKPALLMHSNVETFFHEFGHLIHGLVTNAELSLQSGPMAVELDFVEAPSQMYENWVFQKEVLNLFARHYETNEQLPDSLIEKIIDLKNLNSGLGALRQCFYGSYDFTLHNKYIPYQGESSDDIAKNLRKKIMWYDPLPNTHFQASFGHLTGYGSGYYSYMWSKVYAQDIWSVFEEKGVLNPEVGKRYRKLILDPGGSVAAIDMVRNFLGREPNNYALLKELGVYDVPSKAMAKN